MTPKTLTPLDDLIAAKSALRDLELSRELGEIPQDEAAQQADALRARIARAERANAGLDDEGEPLAPPTLDELRDELARLEAQEAEQQRSERAAIRDGALRAWESARARMRDDLANRAHRDAVRLADHGPFNPTGIADLIAATTDDYDKRMRAAIEALPIHLDPRTSGRVRRIGQLAQEISARESEGQPTAYQRRAARLQAAVEATSTPAA